jgi:hypothetical protein
MLRSRRHASTGKAFASGQSIAMSIHIGVLSVDPRSYGGNTYALNSSGNDAVAMAKIASAMGVGSPLLLVDQPTRAKVINAITVAAGDLTSGDFLLLTYSGHGMQFKDDSGEEPDGQDEAWVLYDLPLVDDELYGLWLLFREGVRIVVVTDSCNNGTILSVPPLRDEIASDGPLEVKTLPREDQLEIYERNKAFYDAIQEQAKIDFASSVEASVLHLAACRDDEETRDGSVNGNSAFTEALLAAMASGPKDYPALRDAIGSRLTSQHPTIETTGENTDALLLSRPFTI